MDIFLINTINFSSFLVYVNISHVSKCLEHIKLLSKLQWWGIIIAYFHDFVNLSDNNVEDGTYASELIYIFEQILFF